MGVRNRALFLLGVNTGFRISELLSLTMGDLLHSNGTLRDRLRVDRRNMKGGKDSRNVFLNEHAKEAILPWVSKLVEMGHCHRLDFVFVGGPAGKRISRTQAWSIFKKAVEAAGLQDATGTHVMRKTFAALFYEVQLGRVAKGEPIDAFRNTSKALGHKNLDSTDRYLSFLVDDIDNGIKEMGI